MESTPARERVAVHPADRIARATLCAIAAALALASVVLALPAEARPGHGPHGWGGPGAWIEQHAEVLGIDDATLAEIGQIVAASREEADAIYEEHRQAREVMHDLLAQDEPDFDAVMEQADVIGEIDLRKHKHRLATMLAVRAKLSPEQRSKLRELKSEMREGHGKACPHCGRNKGECRGDGPPPEAEEL